MSIFQHHRLRKVITDQFEATDDLGMGERWWRWRKDKVFPNLDTATARASYEPASSRLQAEPSRLRGKARMAARLS